MKQVVEIDGRKNYLEVVRKVEVGLDKPRLIIPAYQPTDAARRILKICIDGIKKMTVKGSYELWVVDNNSPWNNCSWLLDCPGINVALCRTKPVPKEERGIMSRLRFWIDQQKWGSYANALGIELALQLIDPGVEKVMTLHMDTLPCDPSWLEYLASKLNGRVKASGVCLEHHRTKDGVLHVLGCIVDYQVARELKLSYWPELPGFDVGDKITLDLKKVGYEIFSCPNTYEEPSLAETIPGGSPLRNLQVVRSFDDAGRVIFLHLGRGIPKASDNYAGKAASLDDWEKFAKENIMELS